MIPVLQRHFADLIRFSTGFSGKNRPYFVSAEVTFRCNLGCEFCNIPRFNPFLQEADTAVMTRRLEESYRMGCRIVSFTGGEPLMRSDIGHLVSACHELGYFTGMVTNGLLLGTCLGGEWLRTLDTMAISFLDDEEAFNRSRRNPRAHATVRENITRAVDGGLRPYIFCTLTSDTLEFAEATAAFADSLGIRVYFTLVQRAPREEYDTIDYTALKVEDTEDALRQLLALRKEYAGVCLDPDFERMQAKGGFNDFIDCRSAQTVISLKPDGSVSLPCPSRTLLSIAPETALAGSWTEDAATRIRRARGTMPFCRDCQVNCMYVPSLIGHPVLIARWIRNNGL